MNTLNKKIANQLAEVLNYSDDELDYEFFVAGAQIDIIEPEFCDSEEDYFNKKFYWITYYNLLQSIINHAPVVEQLEFAEQHVIASDVLLLEDILKV